LPSRWTGGPFTRVMSQIWLKVIWQESRTFLGIRRPPWPQHLIVTTSDLFFLVLKNGNLCKKI
jgi:hypothetical protein